MLAYTKGISKESFVDEMKLHAKLDNFIKGTYDEGQKGCAVGCGIQSIMNIKGIKLNKYEHSLYEEYLGIPEWLAKVEDTLFEGVSLERSKVWPVEFSEAILKGVDLDQVKIPFIVYILEQNIEVQTENLENTTDENIKKIIKECINVNKQMIEVHLNNEDKSAAESARSAAWSAARSAATAASAWSAATAAASAAWSAESAARSAAWSAESAARPAAYEKYADKLLQLLKECK